MKSISRNRLLLILLACLLLVVSCFSFTSSWFTDNEEFGGILIKPVITPKLYYGNRRIIGPLYWNYNEDNNTPLPIYVKFDNDTNVTNLLLRIEVVITWGTKDGGIFTESPTSSDNHVFSSIDENSVIHFSNILNPITTSCIMGENPNDTLMLLDMPQDFYFYNAIYSVPVSSFTDNPITIFDYFEFNEDFAEYKSLTAKIEINVEVDFANETTIEKWEDEEVRPPQDDWEVYND